MLTECAEPQQISETDNALPLLHLHYAHTDPTTFGPCMAYLAAIAALDAETEYDE